MILEQLVRINHASFDQPRFEDKDKPKFFHCYYDKASVDSPSEGFILNEGKDHPEAAKLKTMFGHIGELSIYDVLENLYETRRWTQPSEVLPFELHNGASIVEANYGFKIMSAEQEELAKFADFIVSKGDYVISYKLSDSDSFNLDLWDFNGKHIATLDKHSDEINGVSLLKNGTIISYSKDHTLRLWNNNGEQIKILEGHSKAVFGVQELDNGNLITYGGDAKVIIWHPDGHVLTEIETGHTGNMSKPLIMQDGRIITYSTSYYNHVRRASWEDSYIKIWSPEGKLLQTLDSFEHYKFGGVFLLPMDYILAYERNDCRLFNSKGELVKEIKIDYHSDIDHIEMLENGNVFMFSSEKDMSVWEFKPS